MKNLFKYEILRFTQNDKNDKMKALKIIKIGGNIIDQPDALDDFLSEFSKLEEPKLLVHGGGKLATDLAEKLNVEVKLVDGKRITDINTLDIITMVYAGKINKKIISKLQRNHCNSIGFTGADGNTILSDKRPDKPIDFGYVGDIKHVNIETIQLLLKQHITPVFCAITHDGNGQLLNTNADTIASEIAIAFSELYNVELYYCFEKSGVLQNVEDDNSVIKNIDKNSYAKLLEQNNIAAGMLPKLANAFHAINNQVHKVCIGKPEMLFNKNSKFTTIQN